MKLFKLFFAVAMISLAFSSCRNTEEIAYLKDAQRDSAFALKGQFSGGIRDFQGIFFSLVFELSIDLFFV